MNFRKAILFPFLMALLSSCALPSYQHFYTTPKKLNFKKGQWLIDRIKGPEFIIAEAQDMAWETFHSLHPDSIQQIFMLGGESLLPPHLPSMAIEKALSEIEQYSSFDYWITIQIAIKDDQVASLMPDTPSHGVLQNSAQTTITIYDVHTKSKIYQQKVVGELGLSDQDKDTKLASSADAIAVGTLKRALKELKKNAYY